MLNNLQSFIGEVLLPLWFLVCIVYLYIHIRGIVKKKATAGAIRISTYLVIIVSVYAFNILGIIFVIILILPVYILWEYKYHKIIRSKKLNNN